MAIIGEGISHRGLTSEDFQYPFNVTGTVVAADVGKGVTYDFTAARSVKLAEAGEPVIGILATIENRLIEGTSVGTVALKGGFRLQKAAGTDTIVLGDSVVGSAAPGEVGPRRDAGDTTNEPDNRINVVTSVDGDNIEILIL